MGCNDLQLSDFYNDSSKTRNAALKYPRSNAANCPQALQALWPHGSPAAAGRHVHHLFRAALPQGRGRGQVFPRGHAGRGPPALQLLARRRPRSSIRPWGRDSPCGRHCGSCES